MKTANYSLLKELAYSGRFFSA